MVLVDNPVAGQPVPTSGATTIANALIVKAGGDNIFGDVTTMRGVPEPAQSRRSRTAVRRCGCRS
jgi:iron complex transport system substrate-binding protein